MYKQIKLLEIVNKKAAIIALRRLTQLALGWQDDRVSLAHNLSVVNSWKVGEAIPTPSFLRNKYQEPVEYNNPEEEMPINGWDNHGCNFFLEEMGDAIKATVERVYSEKDKRTIKLNQEHDEILKQAKVWYGGLSEKEQEYVDILIPKYVGPVG
jgi:hypothetical protein